MEMMMFAIVGLLAVQAAGDLPAWTFDASESGRAWEANGQLRNVAVKDGALHAEASGTDPFFTVRGLDIDATPWQYVLVRMKATRSGACELFWTGQADGAYGGFTQEKTTRFSVPGDGAWHEIALFPFWAKEKTIKQLRFDVYDDAAFDIDSVQVLSWGNAADAKTDTSSWTFNGDAAPWRIHPGVNELFAPPLRLNVAAKGWVTVRLQSSQNGTASVIWSTPDTLGEQSEVFQLRGDAQARTYNIELQGLPTWHDTILAFGLSLPPEARLESVAIAGQPSGPADLSVSYFGFENGINRAGQACRVLAQIANDGGAASKVLRATLTTPEGVHPVDATKAAQELAPVAFGEQASLHWDIVADRPGDYEVRVNWEGEGAPAAQTAQVRALPALQLPKADYVPEPKPVATDIDVCAYYFPGWNSDAKWDCIRRVAPIRKPVLGYYDEGNPECVDWQIKWASENGISCFLLDWYWSDGNQMLLQWMDAYRKARYRDKLKIAVMWANHNAPGTNSPEDWRKVTREWIDHYFNLDTYYRINGKPAVFIWNPQGIRIDLKSSDAVRKLFDESQQMARDAGYAGIEFLAVNGHDSSSEIALLLQEGYSGASNYHEWGRAPDRAADPNLLDYQAVVDTVPAAWQARDAAHGALTYYPQADTGWDARPWHGAKSMVIQGRTPDRWEQLLREAKDYCVKNKKPLVVLGPVNEWGEGSYIEPCTEYGFEMYERVRKVFGKGDPATWPVNIGPSDVGLGPYDFKGSPLRTTWSFDASPEGWTAMMNLGEFTCRGGALRMRTASDDPALVVETPGLSANGLSQATLRMQLIGPVPAGKVGQLYWAPGGAAISEAACVRFPLETDGQMHTYTISLKSNPRWRGAISSLRLDPCETKDVEIVIDQVALTK